MDTNKVKQILTDKRLGELVLKKMNEHNELAQKIVDTTSHQEARGLIIQICDWGSKSQAETQERIREIWDE